MTTLHARPAATAPTTRRAHPTRARRLILAGAVSWPLFLLVSFAQALTREGFDLQRHAISMLSLGDLGWIQITAFVATGVAFLLRRPVCGPSCETGPVPPGDRA